MDIRFNFWNSNSFFYSETSRYFQNGNMLKVVKDAHGNLAKDEQGEVIHFWNSGRTGVCFFGKREYIFQLL